MVRTECRKCKHSNKNHSACMVVRQRKDVADWMSSIETEWISPNEYMVMEQALAPTLCPGFEAHPLTTTLVVTHESGEGETQTPLFVPFIQAMEPMPPSTITF